MTVEALYILRRQAPRSAFSDLDRVVLTADVMTDDGDTVEAGSKGTIVGVWRDGEAYEVEFTTPIAGLATLSPDQIIRARSMTRDPPLPARGERPVGASSCRPEAEAKPERR